MKGTYMRKSSIAVLLFLTIPYAAFPQEEIPKENRIILSVSETPSAGEVSWIPSSDEANLALESIRSFLASDTATEPPFSFKRKEILNNFPNYKVKFSGILIAGRKMIHCYFFSKHATSGIIEDSVDDGGSQFWRIDFDPENKTCINFMSNGES